MDYSTGETYPVTKWYIDDVEIEIWHGNKDEFNISHLWVVEKDYPDYNCKLILAPEAMKIIYGVN